MYVYKVTGYLDSNNPDKPTGQIIEYFASEQSALDCIKRFQTKGCDKVSSYTVLVRE